MVEVVMVVMVVVLLVTQPSQMKYDHKMCLALIIEMLLQKALGGEANKTLTGKGATNLVIKIEIINQEEDGSFGDDRHRG